MHLGSILSNLERAQMQNGHWQEHLSTISSQIDLMINNVRNVIDGGHKQDQNDKEWKFDRN